MIIVISDLHLQHTSHDLIRYKEGDTWKKSGLRRNVGAGAFKLLFETVFDRAVRARSDRIDIVFAGDIFEIHRTPLWLTGNPDEPSNPYDQQPSENQALKTKVNRILNYVQNESKDCWDVIDTFVREGNVTRNGTTNSLKEAEDVCGPDGVHTHYLPGNHDRLLNAWPETRKRVRDLLSIDAPDPEAPFPHSKSWTDDDNYPQGVLIRHGHEYDPYNFPVDVEEGNALDKGQDTYLKPTFGAYMTVDFATRLATAFRVYNEVEMRDSEKEKNEKALRKFYLRLLEFDDVRPLSVVPEYLKQICREAVQNEQDIVSHLIPALKDIRKQAEETRFIQKKGGAKTYFLSTELFDRLIEPLTGNLDVDTLETAIDLFSALSDTPPPRQIARHEPDVQNNHVELVIAGHTHEPGQVPIRYIRYDDEKTPQYYMNSGTWRTRIPNGLGETFGRLRSYTSIFCYDADEIQQFDDERTFETWTGHMEAPKFDRFKKDVSSDRVNRAPARLQFRELRINRIPDEIEAGTAELSLELGVDATKQRWEGTVENQKQVTLDLDRIDVPPATDGDVWIRGVEQDANWLTFIDPDDPLPWGLTNIPLDEEGEFEPGEHTFAATDQLGTEIVVVYEISGQ